MKRGIDERMSFCKRSVVRVERENMEYTDFPQVFLRESEIFVILSMRTGLNVKKYTSSWFHICESVLACRKRLLCRLCTDLKKTKHSQIIAERRFSNSKPLNQRNMLVSRLSSGKCNSPHRNQSQHCRIPISADSAAVIQPQHTLLKWIPNSCYILNKTIYIYNTVVRGYTCTLENKDASKNIFDDYGCIFVHNNKYMYCRII